MSVYRRFTGHDLPFFVTTNTVDRTPLFAAEASVLLLTQVIAEVRHETKFRLHAWVLMPDHIHMVLSTPNVVAVGDVMRLVKGRFANRHNRQTERCGSVWQSRFHERALRNDAALMRAIDYVHMNPVEAGLVERAEDYRWSSAKWWACRVDDRSWPQDRSG